MRTVHWALGCALIAGTGSVQAAVLVDITGVATGRSIPGFDIENYNLDPGAYRLTITADRYLVRVNSNAGTMDHYHLICPGNPPFECGGNNNRTFLQFNRVTDEAFAASFRLLPPREVQQGGLVRSYFADTFFGGFTELIDPAIFNGPPTPVPFRLVLESVPEPASWAMMIAGFGLLGAAARRRTGQVRFA